MRNAMRSVVVALFIASWPSTQASWAKLGPPIGSAEALRIGLISHAEALEAGAISGEEAHEAALLWNECRPVEFKAHLQGQDAAKKIGLTGKAIETAVRSRLRGARLFLDAPDLRARPTKAAGYLRIGVHLLRDGFVSWRVHFEKPSEDLATGLVGFSPTGWHRAAFGGNVRDGNRILYGIASALDEFVDEYLRVNKSACER